MDNMYKHIPTPGQILEERCNEFLGRCISAIRQYRGQPIYVNLLEVPFQAQQYAIRELAERGWSARERRRFPGFPELEIMPGS
ncbi:MAG: hypothetical protein HY711_09585 [Candidatus Melainabacteria bacterium]|nr:hypothetical protein [Candidatus Melainabacteria bacterium]